MNETFDASEIEVYNEVFSKEDFKQINNFLRRPLWGYGNISHPKDEAIPFFTMSFRDEPFFNDYCLSRICDVLGKKYKLRDCYANGHIFGTQGSPHQDAPSKDYYTFLLYSNQVGPDIRKWKPQWGGKTVFFLNEEEHHYVLPKPNTGTLFPSNIFHYAESTTRHFSGLRMSVAWKLITQ